MKGEAISIRVSPKVKEWLKKEKLSQSKVFKNALKELGYKGKGVK